MNMEIGPIVTRFPWIYIRVKKCNSIRAFYLKLLLKITFSRSTFVCMETLDIIYIPKYSVRRRTCSWAIWVLRPTTNTRFFCMTRTWARRSRFNSTEAIVGATAGFGFDTEPKIYIGDGSRGCYRGHPSWEGVGAVLLEFCSFDRSSFRATSCSGVSGPHLYGSSPYGSRQFGHLLSSSFFIRCQHIEHS